MTSSKQGAALVDDHAECWECWVWVSEFRGAARWPQCAELGVSPSHTQRNLLLSHQSSVRVS